MKRARSLAFVVLLLAGSARAQPSATDANARARVLFQDGLALAQQGDLPAALREFEAAYAASPHYSVLYNIAQTRAALGHPVEAVTAFQRYLADGGKHVSEARRAEVQALIAANNQRVGRLRIVGGTATTRIWLDGAEITPEARAGAISVARGEHIVLFADGVALPQSLSAAVTSDDVVEVTIPTTRAVASPPTKSSAQLVVSCNVPDIEVEINGVHSFKTPQKQPVSVDAGRIALRFARPGYPTLSRNALVAEGQLTRLDCEQHPLSPVPPQLAAHLELVLDPTDADVSIDGQRYAGGPLPAGAHRLRAERDGYMTVERPISVASGRTLLQQVSLKLTPRERERIEHARARSRAVALVLGGLGVAVLGASAGVYAWNSSRYDDWQAKREQGTATAEDAARIQRGDDAALGLLVGGGALTLGAAWVFWDSP